MRISNVKNGVNFKGGLNNKLLLKSLETVSNHPASFVAGTTLLMSTIVRPLSIALTPKTDKENKKYAISDSVSSGVIKFAISELVALPVEKAINNINKNPEKILNPNTVKNLKEHGKTLIESKNYKFTEQLIKNSSNLITAIPKSMIAVALIPCVNALLFPEKKSKNNKKLTNNSFGNLNPVFAPFNKEEVSFKGVEKPVMSGVKKIFDSKILQNYVKKHSYNDTNIVRNMTLTTDALLAGSFALRTKKSRKIKEDRKNPLIYNKLITTAISILGGYQIDNLVQKGTKSFIEKFKQANINDPKLDKYIQGINVVRPTLIFAALYYGVLPVISMFTADKADKLSKKSFNSDKNA